VTTTDEVELPRWSVADVHESLDARSFVDAMERLGADVSSARGALRGTRHTCDRPRDVTSHDGTTADAAICARTTTPSPRCQILRGLRVRHGATDTRAEAAQSLLSEISVLYARTRPLVPPVWPSGSRRSVLTHWPR
jgi:oligoendopeptidase F